MNAGTRLIAVGCLVVLPAMSAALGSPPPSSLAPADIRQDAADGPPHQSSPRDDSDWLRYVPGDVGFYVEVRDLIGLRQRFQRHGVWHVIREIAEADRSAASQPSTPLPGLDSDRAISELIGRRGGLFARKSSQWESGVLFAELGQRGDIHRWRARWNARRLPDVGPVECYILDGGLRMAVLDRLMTLGPADDPTDLWGRSVRLMSGTPGANLRGESEFASLHSRLSHAPTGIAFVSWEKGDRFAISGLSRMLVGFDFGDPDLRFEIHGIGPGSNRRIPPCDREVIERLPDNTLIAWSGSIAPDTLTTDRDSGMAMSSLSPLGLFLGFLKSLSTDSGRLAEQLGPRVTVAIGPDSRQAGPTDLMLPSAAVIVEARHVNEVSEQIGHIMEFVGGMARMAASTQSVSTSPLTRTESVEGVEYRVLDIGQPLAQRLELPFLQRLEVAWTGFDERLIVTSSESQLRGIISAMRGRKPGLGGVVKTLPASHPSGSENEPVQWSMVRGSQVSRVLRNWLGYVRRNHPEALRDEWWQEWATDRARKRTRFGVALRSSQLVSGGADVMDVETNSPANGFLRAGDVIVAVSDQPLPADSPAKEAAKRYANRGAARVFRIAVIREGRRIDVHVPVEPLPDREIRELEPMRALRQLVILLRNVDAITMVRRESRSSRLELEIRVMWDQGAGARRDTASTPSR